MSLVALIDGPLPADHPSLAGRHDLTAGATCESPAGRHAAAMARAILAGAPAARIVSIAILPGQLTASAAALARALELAGGSAARVVHCSLGLARNDAAVAAAVARLAQAGLILVASAAARGGPVFPAALPEVIAVQGDARCRPGQWSRLALPTADYGACPQSDTPSDVAGSSVAAARLTGILARLAPSTPAEARRILDTGAAFHGRERREA